MRRAFVGAAVLATALLIGGPASASHHVDEEQCPNRLDLPALDIDPCKGVMDLPGMTLPIPKKTAEPAPAPAHRHRGPLPNTGFDAAQALALGFASLGAGGFGVRRLKLMLQK